MFSSLGYFKIVSEKKVQVVKHQQFKRSQGEKKACLTWKNAVITLGAWSGFSFIEPATLD